MLFVSRAEIKNWSSEDSCAKLAREKHRKASSKDFQTSRPPKRHRPQAEILQAADEEPGF